MCASKKSKHSSGRINSLQPINFTSRFIALWSVLFIYQARSSLVTWLGDVAAEEDEPEKRLACWWLNCSGIPARYGRCLRYAYIVRYSGFANPVRDSVRPAIYHAESKFLLAVGILRRSPRLVDAIYSIFPSTRINDHTRH